MADISNPDTYKDSFPSKKQFSCCPLRMSDGRSITDYRPKCIVNYELMKHISEKNLVRSSYETRMYLQSNADTIMENDIKKAKDKLLSFPGNCKATENVDNGTLLPVKYLVSCDAVSCHRKEFDKSGLGDDRSGDTSLILENNFE